MHLKKEEDENKISHNAVLKLSLGIFDGELRDGLAADVCLVCTRRGFPRAFPFWVTD